MKKVLFIGMTEYDLLKDNASLEVKFKGLGKFIRVYVMARGSKWSGEKYGAKFFLIPKKVSLPLWLLIVFFRSWFLIRKENIDFIVSQSPSFEGVVSSLLKIVCRKRLIVEVHGDWIESPFFYHHLRFKRTIKWLLVRCGRFSLSFADKVRVISDFTKNLAQKHCPKSKPYYKFPTFMDIDKFFENENIYWNQAILYVGVLYRLKGVHFLIQAMSEIQVAHPQARLIITGDGPYRQTLSDLAKELNFDNIQFTGQLSADQVRSQMKNCLALVLPSLSEGLGRVLIEAAALGKPIIGSRTGGIPEIIKDSDNGFLISPGDVKALKEKLEWILSHQEEAKKMGARGRILIKNNFSTGNYFHEFKTMIES